MRRLVLILVLAFAWASPAHGQGLRGLWWDRAPVADSAYYTIKTDLAIEEARSYARHLDVMYEEYQRRLASLRPRGPEKLNVYIFSRQREYLLTMRVRWGIDATGTGGMFFVNDAGSGLAFWTEDLSPRRVAHIMQHEGFHQFAWSRFGTDLPMWANEGLAEFFGLSVLVGNRLVLGQSTPHVLRTVQEAIERDRLVPFRRLLEMTNEQWNTAVAEGLADVHYEQSWSMVHFLVYADEGRYQQPFERYLTLLNAGVRRDDAWQRVFGDDLEAFERKWRDYAAALEPSGFVTALERIEFLAEGALELARRRVIPASLDELQESLAAIGFKHSFDHEGQHVVLRAADAENFTIPSGTADPAGADPRPVFVVEAPRPGGYTRREQRQMLEHPQPPDIRTEHLGPKGLNVDWRRDRETGIVTYRIRVD